MPRWLWLVPFFPYGASIACGDPDIAPYDVNVGSPQGAVALGEKAEITLRVGSTDRRDHDYGWCGRAPSLPELTIDHASCVPDCTATVEPDGDGVEIGTTTAGTKSIDVRAHTSDGHDASRLATVEFRAATRLNVTRDLAHSASGTAHGMLTNDQQVWSVVAADDRGPLITMECAIDVSSSPELGLRASCSTDAPHASPSVRPRVVFLEGLAPGRATFTARYGGISRNDVVRIFAPEEIRRAELRQVLVSSAEVPIERDALDAYRLAPSPLPVRFRCPSEDLRVVPWLEAEDGTIVLGGARHLASEPAQGLVVETPFQVARIAAAGLADGNLVATYGATMLSVPYVVRSGCRDVDREPVDAGDGAAPDARDEADRDADADADDVDAGEP